ncbi:MAG: hypothetical protein HY794_03665 [Desulfarculus sp.]|nr:hypothetical protein [Desulfarculus sp.]
MRPLSLKRLLLLALGLLLMVQTAGCFDYELELELTKTGHGGTTVQLSLPEQVAAQYHVGSLDTLIWPVPQRSRQVVEGRLVVKERNTFDNLDDLAARRVLFHVKEIGTGLAGMGDYAYRVTVRLEMAEGDLPDRQVQPGFELEKRSPQALPDDPAQRRARDLRTRGLAGHHLTVAIKFPGTVSLARPLVVGASEVPAESQQGGSRVAWKVPLSVLVNENVRDTLTFSADFKGFMVFRAYEQKDALSHYPDAFEEALGRGESLPGWRVQFYRQQQQQYQKQQDLNKQQQEQYRKQQEQQQQPQQQGK